MPIKKKSILYPTALVHKKKVCAKTTEKGQFFQCIGCREQMILRRSDNTGWNSKRPHFSHKEIKKLKMEALSLLA